MRRLLFLTLVLVAACAALATDAPGGFQQPDPKRYPDLFLWKDTCNVYVVRSGEVALLIDLGDGSVLRALPELGIRRVEWVLFTHHQREQCQGAALLDRGGTKVAAPEAERALFERPTEFRKMTVRLGDAFTIHGSSYVRPPVEPIPIDHAFKKMDTFSWRGHEFWCVDTKGNSPGSMSYLLRQGTQWLAFTGDLMVEGARLHTWFDSEWDYGFGAGIWALCNSAAQVAGYDPNYLLPSHGSPIHLPARELAEFRRKLVRLEKLLVRGYPVSSFSSAVQDNVSRPSRVPHVWQVSPHIYKFRGPDTFPNFYLLVSDSGHGLAVDCGLLDPKSLDDALEGLQREAGLKQIDAVVVTHMHGDHFLQVPHLRTRWGAQVWGLDRMAAVCEHPAWFDYAAPIQAYGNGIEGLKFDRLFRDGESFEWEGHRFTVNWMPGQTEFALCLWGMVDGRKVAFTGDNLFGDPEDPSQNGHEAVMSHNSAILEEGYIYCAEYLRRLKPDLLLGGHSFVMNRPAKLIERFRSWAYEMRDAFRELSSTPDYRFWFDPYWVRAEPYRVSLRPGTTVSLKLNLRNFANSTSTWRLAVHAPSGLTSDPPSFEVRLAAEKVQATPIRLHADPAMKPGVYLVAFDVTREGERCGELFDCVVEVK